MSSSIARAKKKWRQREFLQRAQLCLRKTVVSHLKSLITNDQRSNLTENTKQRKPTVSTEWNVLKIFETSIYNSSVAIHVAPLNFESAEWPYLVILVIGMEIAWGANLEWWLFLRGPNNYLPPLQLFLGESSILLER